MSINTSNRTITNYAWLSESMAYCRANNIANVLDVIHFAQKEHKSICFIGGRNSFGDIQIKKNSIALDLSLLNKLLYFDKEQGIVRVEAGIKTVDVLKNTIPYGWTLPSLSGSLNNVIGGNISANINGKDSWKNGNFYHGILRMRVVFADSTCKWISRNEDSILFNSIVGGLGLIALIVEVELKLIPVKSEQLIVETKKFRNSNDLIEVMNHMSLNNSNLELMYGWMDLNVVKKKNLGNSYLKLASFKEKENDLANHSFDVLKESENVLGINHNFFWRCIRAFSKTSDVVRIYPILFYILNRLIYHSAKEGILSENYLTFLYPMAGKFAHWKNRFYPLGFREVQIHLPILNNEILESINDLCRKYDIVPELCGVRKHLPDPSLLSFSGNGISFTINYNLNRQNKKYDSFERKLVAIIIKEEGKINLSKFPFVNKDELFEMYTKSKEFFDLKNKFDPNYIFSNNAWNRWTETN